MLDKRPSARWLQKRRRQTSDKPATSQRRLSYKIRTLSSDFNIVIIEIVFFMYSSHDRFYRFVTKSQFDIGYFSVPASTSRQLRSEIVSPDFRLCDNVCSSF